MNTYRVKTVADLLGVSDDTVRRWVDDGTLAASRDTGRIMVDGRSVAELAQKLADGSIAGGDVRGSTRNEFMGIVTRVQIEGLMAQIDLQCGPYRVVSIITAEAARELALEPGSLASAQVKATHVTVRRDVE